jgi:hypothetical protein
MQSKEARVCPAQLNEEGTFNKKHGDIGIARTLCERAENQISIR